jgi:3-hydroxyisobutyrate dehydrogenase-like beta-hydroxyacid dehydrogenase
VTVMLDNTIDKRTARIGFIGLGLMGSRLTRRLHSSGWNVQAWNRSPDPAQSLGRDGVEISSSIAQLVAESK